MHFILFLCPRFTFYDIAFKIFLCLVLNLFGHYWMLILVCDICFDQFFLFHVDKGGEMLCQFWLVVVYFYGYMFSYSYYLYIYIYIHWLVRLVILVIYVFKTGFVFFVLFTKSDVLWLRGSLSILSQILTKIDLGFVNIKKGDIIGLFEYLTLVLMLIIVLSQCI